MLERYRWVLFGAAAVLIGLGFYLNHRREDNCAPDGSCPPQSTRLRTINRLVLWLCAALVVLFALFPQVITTFAPASRDSASVTRLTSDARELRDAFNRDIGTVRIVALLSPT
jgi:hypothetical protein